MNLTVVNNPSVEEAANILKLMHQTHWGLNRTLEEVTEMLELTQASVLLKNTQTGETVGFARALSDKHYKAIIEDVIIDQKHQNKKIGKTLMQAILNHPSLDKTEEVELYCRPTLRRFYEQVGFIEVDDQIFMRIVKNKTPKDSKAQ